MPGSFAGFEGCHTSSWRAQAENQYSRDDRGSAAQGREDWSESLVMTLNVLHHWNVV